MSRWVEVPVTIFKTFAIEIEADETIDDAKQYAMDECMGDDAEVGDCVIAENDLQADSIRRHADAVLALN